jgi:hypothetical protein
VILRLAARQRLARQPNRPLLLCQFDRDTYHLGAAAVPVDAPFDIPTLAKARLASGKVNKVNVVGGEPANVGLALD